jgi:hypothetical protein
MILDVLTTATAMGLVSWATVLGGPRGRTSLWATAASVSYPLSDIALLVVCFLVLSRSRVHRVPLGFIAAGLVLMAVADSGYASLVATNSSVTGDMIDLSWVFAFGVLAFATLAPGATSSDSPAQTLTVAGAVLPTSLLALPPS